ncbi:hypothetical protein [Marinobacter nauticus]|uniref:hypothetical protein n=1 Tax=Marinobacter nauticus TaxID=2743 RepID=UPI001C98FCF3|nr:hypothetical protein [Marinobacter nauticus]MBY5961321.1 hypothetical protein [Marinobacter nauticus]
MLDNHHAVSNEQFDDELLSSDVDFRAANKGASQEGIIQPSTLFMIRPADRLRMLIEHRFELGLDPVFTTQDLKPWFQDMSETAMRVMVNRQCAKGEAVLSVCHGVYRVAHLNWTSAQILVAAAKKLRNPSGLYLTMHSAIAPGSHDEEQPFLVCMTAGRDVVLKSEQHGVIALKHTELPINEQKHALDWDARLGCWRADYELALSDYQRHHAGLKSILRYAKVSVQLPHLTREANRWPNCPGH